MYELIYYGNGPIMADVLTSITYVLNTSDYGTLLQVMLVLSGVLMIRGWHFVNANGGPGMHGLGVSALIILSLYYGGWAPKTDVVVKDPINNFQTAVHHIPQGLGIVLWASNRLTSGFTDLFDQAFTSGGFPSNFDYENSGGALPSILSVTALNNITPNNGYLMMSIENYINQCFMKEVMLGGKQMDIVGTSTDLLTDIKTDLNDSWYGTYYSAAHPQGENVYCDPNGGSPNLYTLIKQDLTTAVQGTGTASAKLATFYKMLSIPKINNGTDAVNILQSAGNYILGGSSTSEQLLSQAILVNAFNPQLSDFANVNGLNSQAVNSALTQSALNTTTTMTTSYALASVFLPMSFLVANAFVISILPLLFAMMFIPELTKKYGFMTFDLLMWLAFWGPIGSIVNYIVQSYAAASTSKVMAGALTYGKFPYLMSHAHTLMAIAGDIMFSTPVIAFALASGSAYAMTSMASGVAGLSKSAAATGSGRMTTQSGIQSEETAGKSTTAEGYGTKSTNKNLQGYLEMESNVNAAKMAGSMGAIQSMGGTGKYMESVKNSAASGMGSGLGYNNASEAFGTGMAQTQKSAGSVAGEMGIAAKNNDTMYSLGQKGGGQSATKTEGTNEGFFGNYTSMQNTQSEKAASDLKENRAMVQSLQRIGELPQNFNSLSPNEQSKQMASAVSSLGAVAGGFQGMVLSKPQAQKFFNDPNAVGGQYKSAMDGQGNLEMVSGKEGSNIYSVDKGGEWVKSSAIDSKGNVGKPVMTRGSGGYKNEKFNVTQETATGNLHESLAKLGLGGKTMFDVEGAGGSVMKQGNLLSGNMVVSGAGEKQLAGRLKGTKAGEMLNSLHSQGKAASVGFAEDLGTGKIANVTTSYQDKGQMVSNTNTDLQDKMVLGDSVKLGNGIDAKINAKTSVGELTKDLNKSYAGFLRTNNEKTFLAGAMGAFGKVMPIASTKYNGGIEAGKGKKDQNMDTISGHANLSLGLGGGGSSAGIGGGYDHKKISTDEQHKSNKAGYSSTYDTLQEKYRENAVGIYNLTKGMEDPSERQNMRATLLANSMKSVLGEADLNAKTGRQGTVSPAASDVPVMGADNSGQPIQSENADQMAKDQSDLTNIIHNTGDGDRKWKGNGVR